MKFLHIMLRVKDIEKSLFFYQNLFDMNLTKTMELEDCRLYFLSDEDGQTQIELTHNFDTPTEGYSHGSAFGHLAFEVQSITAFSEKMKTLGLGEVQEVYSMPRYDMQIAFIEDPDGNSIELIEPTYYLA